jgi:hypothetical protein
MCVQAAWTQCTRVGAGEVSLAPPTDSLLSLCGALQSTLAACERAAVLVPHAAAPGTQKADCLLACLLQTRLRIASLDVRCILLRHGCLHVRVYVFALQFVSACALQ